MQRFKPKRRVKKMALFKAILLIIITIFIFKFITNLFARHKDLVISSMFLDRKYSYDKKDENIFSKFYDYAKENIINTPSNMLVNRVVYKEEIPSGSKNKDDVKEESIVVSNDKNEEKVEKVSDEPLIYIYNSHQKEEYSKEYMED